MKHTNSLINATSPYLLQHAHNPVNWNSWAPDVIERAKREDKLILVSIGYAACHWCHVMEHESFEDEEVAQIMNEHFIPVKVDREERPDVDHYYMNAVQLMFQQGGWPLNVIALPDGRPIWGGTYFPKERWMESLQAVAKYYRDFPAKTNEYAAQLEEGIEQITLGVESGNEMVFSRELLKEGVEAWKNRFDMKEGGRLGAPKFPLPVTLEFLLYYGVIKNDKTCLDFVHLTLEKMERGGIYDQVGGGFARYSVDGFWKVPHFEKMLYDNGQLLSIYSKAFHQFKTEEFKCVVYEIVDFVEREMMDESGAFYSSLDADSEGEEGRFYVWYKPLLKKLLNEDYTLFDEYYGIEKNAHWESGNYILLKQGPDLEFADKYDLTAEELKQKVGKWKYILLQERTKRTRPGLDDKTLTSWNALALKGLVEAYQVFQEEHFLQLAVRNANFLANELMLDSGQLKHNWKKGSATIDGFLEDYALLIQAWLTLFEVTGKEKWLVLADKLNRYVFDHFYDSKSGLFLFSEINSENSVGNHFQNEDNVIPAANSVMANNLHRLYLLFGKPEYLETAKKMLPAIVSNYTRYPMAYANWGNFILKLTEPYYEVVVSGINSNQMLTELQKQFRPNVMWAHLTSESDIPLLKDRFVIDDDLIYICSEGACHLPSRTAGEALKLLNQ